MFKNTLVYSDAQTKTLIGKGTYAEVFKLVYGPSPTTTKVTVGCKISSKDENTVFHSATLREVAFLSAMNNHPNIMQPLDMEINVYHSMLIYMPFYETTLKTYIRKKKVCDMNWIVEGILKGLDFIHSVGICHRDLKTENILLNPATKEIKLCDFGLCRFVTSGESTLKIVSAPYRPPEILINKETGIVDMYKVDIWSIGCVLYEIYAKKYLFTPYKNDKRQLKKIEEVLESDWMDVLLSRSGVNEAHCKIIKKCIVIDPVKRTSIREVCEELCIECDKWHLVDSSSIKNGGVPHRMSEENWSNLKNMLCLYMNNKKNKTYTKDLAVGYMYHYMSKYNIKSDYVKLLYKSAYYIAVRLNETYFPSHKSVFENEYSLHDINDMEKYIIQACEGNLWSMKVVRTPSLTKETDGNNI